MVEVKYFLCGLNENTQNKDLYNYFNIFKKLIDYIVIKNKKNPNKKIGFISFETDNIKLLNNMLISKKHTINGNKLKIIKAKNFVQNKDLQFDKKNINEKLFIGGLPPSKNLKEKIINYFSKYGNILYVSIKIQKSDKEDFFKRFAFLVFKNKESAIKTLNDYKLHKINQKWIEVKPYLPKNIPNDKKKLSIQTNDTYNLNNTIIQKKTKIVRSKSFNKIKEITLFKILNDCKLNYFNNINNLNSISLYNSYKIKLQLLNEIKVDLGL